MLRQILLQQSFSLMSLTEFSVLQVVNKRNPIRFNIRDDAVSNARMDGMERLDKREPEAFWNARGSAL